MRRTSLLAAALTAASSLALLAPAAHAGSLERLTASATCTNGGTIRVSTTVAEDGTERARATVDGVALERWAGRILLGPQIGAGTSTTDVPLAAHVARHGRFHAAARLVGAQSHDALGEFYGLGLKDVCVAGVEVGSRGLVAGDHDNGLVVQTGGVPRIGMAYVGTKGHRYRFAFTVVAHGRVQHRTLVATARRHGVAVAQTRAFIGVPDFTRADVTVTDLRTHQSAAYGVSRG